MLEVAARIPDAAARDQFADRLAHKARITEEVVRAEIRKAAAKRETAVAVLERPDVVTEQVKTAEKGLIWALMRDQPPGSRRCAELDEEDLDGLATKGNPPAGADPCRNGPPDALPERLSSV